MKNDYKVGTIVEMKKSHPCGSNSWCIIRLGADIKIKCLNCGRVVMIPRIEFNKRIKKIVVY
ncbi:MAG: DUF951 domain-containing protein [Clostridium sp.]|nr:DUF951 domain-containing protein [Clostridium sp.]MCM1443798.1 DUF951 domain-containing protein [Candidatus Amulumruptor caecigallinarius]